MTEPNSETPEVKASLSALSVAWGFTRALATKYQNLFSHQELQLSKHFCVTGKHSLSQTHRIIYEGMTHLPYFIQQSIYNKVVIPAHDQVIMLRKLMIKDKIAHAIENGVKQIIFLGGGYDIRALMTALDTHVKVFELDRRPTRISKLNGIKTIPSNIGLGNINIQEEKDGTVVVNGNMFFIECDFIQDNLQDVLKSHQFQPHEKTLIIAEGLTAYLDEAQNKRLLDSINSIMDTEDELLLSYITQGEKTKVFDAALQSSGESHQLSLTPDDVIGFAGKNGFAIHQQFDATKMLSSIGNTKDAEFYQTKQNQLKEYYYFMKKGPVLTYTAVDVPFYQFDLKPSEPMNKGQCTLI